MKGRKKPGLGVMAMLAALLLLAGLPAACGNADKKSTSPATAQLQTSATYIGMDACTTCHTDITVSWLSSRHANTNGDPSGNESTYTNSCTVCHDPQGDSTHLVAGYTGSPRPVVGCETCHGPGSLHSGAGAISRNSGTYLSSTFVIGPVTVSGQFAMCTSCHSLLNSTTGLQSSYLEHGSSTTTDQVIWDTHYATAGTYTANGLSYNSPITGYAMDFSGETVCVDCHNPHGTADINRDWAASKHAATAQELAGTTTAQYHAWNHYNWSCDGTDPLTCGPTTTATAPTINDRRYCQRCHTTTGHVAYNDALSSGNTALVNALRMGTSTVVPFSEAWKPEMLECRGCHTDPLGTIRNPGAYAAVYEYRVTDVGAATGTLAAIKASATFSYPDAGHSNGCVLCHSGRTNGGTITNLNTAGQPTTVDFSNLKPTNSHDFPDAAIMYRALGYQYSGRNYDNPSSYLHDQIGTTAVPNTGTGGPCVGCHMYRSDQVASHLFSNVTLSTDDATIVNISSEVCYNCHAGSSTQIADMAETERDAFNDARSALGYLLKLKGFSSSSNTNWLSTSPTYSNTDTDTTGNTTGKNNLGAYFNYSSLGNAPGAFVHNSKYVKKLIYDSFDWADDNQMNYSVGTTLSSLCSVTTPSTWCDNATPTPGKAQTYLLPNGVRNGAPSERPY